MQPVGIKLTAQRELHLHRIHVVAALHGAGVEEQSRCKGVSGSTSAIA
ncbi:hypothetical protein I553_3011 [Mycobacterium xenopi 4042]|uniref:Uncharacterized protein n=1 Tax=Mycobacterium xenopi 4042 TaxID=1299334 RepID=X7ZMZ8_MYCXE|nr:hypothetical protein I553_3011 [Mycobacterium xenopi 4042]